MNFVKKTLISVSILLFLIGIFNFYIDPFYVFSIKNKILDLGERNQNLGIALRWHYDAAIVGTSMVQNSMPSIVDKSLNVNSIKLTIAGGQAEEFNKLFSQIFKSNNDIKHIIWSLDLYTLFSNVSGTRFDFPKYTYDKNLINISDYLLNKDIFLNYSIPYLFYLNNSAAVYNKNESYTWYNDSYFDKCKVIGNYSWENNIYYDELQDEEYLIKLYKDNSIKNLSLLTNYIKNNKTTNFYIYVPPYSILFWHNNFSYDNSYKARFNVLKIVYHELLNYENVKLFWFMDEIEWITNLNNYKDYTHFKKEMNDEIFFKMFSGENKVNDYNDLKIKISNFNNFIVNYDFEQVINENGCE